MKCPDCEKLEFIITELKEQLDVERKEVKRLKEIIREMGE